MKKMLTLICAGVLMSALCAAVTACNDEPQGPRQQQEGSRGEEQPGERNEQNEESFFYTGNGEKAFFNVRKDRVIIKTASAEDAKALCRQDVFLSDRPAHDVAYIWVFASIDPKKTSLDDLLKLPGVVDAAYGLEYEDGTLQYPTDKIYAGFKGFSPEEALGKAGLTENVVEIELCDADRKGYDVTLDVKLSDILRICRNLYESGLCEWAEPSFFREMKSPSAFF